MKIYGLIPAAGRARDISGRDLDTPSALNRILGKPIIVGIVENLIAVGVGDILVGIEEKFKATYELALLNVAKKTNIKLFAVDRFEGPLATIKLLLSQIENPESVLINLGDTILTLDNNFFEVDFAVYTSKQVTDHRWSRVSVDHHRRVISFLEKNIYSKDESLETLCGIYWFRDTAQLLEKIRTIPSSSPISDLLQEYKEKIICFPSDDWIDSDHMDIFEMAKNRLLESRSFNRISLDIHKGEVTKKSINDNKLRAEILFYQRIPENLEKYFPKMLQFDLGLNPFQILEYVPWPTLSEVMKYEILDKAIWEEIFTFLAHIIFDEFESVEVQGTQNITEEFYEKILVRNENLLALPKFDSNLILAEGPARKTLDTPDL